jgi:predicted GIY-YIG superfamily endonuclease
MNQSKVLEDLARSLTQHVKEKGEKYEKYNTADWMSNAFWIDSIIKYAIEIKSDIENKTTPPKENLLSIAHIAGILLTAYNLADPKLYRSHDDPDLITRAAILKENAKHCYTGHTTHYNLTNGIPAGNYDTLHSINKDYDGE